MAGLRLPARQQAFAILSCEQRQAAHCCFGGGDHRLGQPRELTRKPLDRRRLKQIAGIFDLPHQRPIATGQFLQAEGQVELRPRRLEAAWRKRQPAK